MTLFDNNRFLGYVNQVTPQFIKIHFPSSNLLGKFYYNGINYEGGNVGSYIVIEGNEYGFLARIIELDLPESERKEMNEKAIINDDSNFHPSGKAELLLSFNIFDPNKTQKTVSKYPIIGAKIYACSNEQIEKYVEEFGKKEDEQNNVYAKLGKLTSNEADCNISLNALFGRHCAVVGTTGGGKSWTVSKLIESLQSSTKNKIILVDATGEYHTLKSKSYNMGIDSYFPYEKLSIQDLFFLLRPTGQSQRPILLEAIRALKIMRLRNTDTIYEKRNKQKQKFNEFYQQNITKIEDNLCNFNILFLVPQIKEECIYQTGFTNKIPDTSIWGDYDAKTYDYQTSLISRITDLINTDVFNKLLGFNKKENCNSIIEIIDSFIGNNKGENILRINFEDIPSTFSAKEIIANAIASYLLNKARKKEFVENPVVLFVDEAHQFLNNEVQDDNSGIQSLNAFDLIAKECRKYGLFICLSTQMPRDIPIGTLSQMGSFIVHRLINEYDKKAIENAASSLNRNVLSFLPILGEGEALVLGVDFPMPLLIKIYEPNTPPKSNTPQLSKKIIDEQVFPKQT